MKIHFQPTIEPLIPNGRKAVEVGKNMNYTLANSRIGKYVYTRSCNSCSALLLNANGNNFLTHIDPKNFNMRTFLEALRYKISSFQDKFGEAKAVIIGGWASDRKDPKCTIPSDFVYSTMARAIDNMPLTMICGKREGIKTLDNIYANNNDIYIANNSFAEMRALKEGHSPQDMERNLFDNYECVEIDTNMI